MGDKEQLKHKLLVSLDGVGTTFFIEPKNLPAIQDLLRVLYDNALYILCDKNRQGITEVEERCNVYWQRTPDDTAVVDEVECNLEDGEECHSRGCATGDMMICDKTPPLDSCDDEPVVHCTWYYRDSGSTCGNEALHKQYGKDGKVWANLCKRHFIELEDAIQSLDAKQIMSSWIKAGGGAKEMAARTVK